MCSAFSIASASSFEYKETSLYVPFPSLTLIDNVFGRNRRFANKFAESRLSNTRKVKRFRKIIVSPKCKNVIKELQPLTYKKDRNGKTIYDQFNIDPHTFSAIWYALDTVTVADVKDKLFNSRKGGNWTRPDRKEYTLAEYE